MMSPDSEVRLSGNYDEEPLQNYTLLRLLSLLCNSLILSPPLALSGSFPGFPPPYQQPFRKEGIIISRLKAGVFYAVLYR